MTRRITPEEIRVQGQVGSGRIRFLAVVAHGRGRREIPVDVDPDVICKLADALRATRGTACDNKPGEFDTQASGYHVGHAVWHILNPERPMPCTVDLASIDVSDRITYTHPLHVEECKTCLGAGRIRDGETGELRRCLDCGGRA